MRDITLETQAAGFQRMLREYADLIKKMSDNYAEQALHTIDTTDQARREGVSEGLAICAEFFAKVSGWDSPDERKPPPARVAVHGDDSLDARRAWFGYDGPWTGEFEDAVNRGEVDVS